MTTTKKIDILILALRRIIHQVPGESPEPDLDIAIVTDFATAALQEIGEDPWQDPLVTIEELLTE